MNVKTDQVIIDSVTARATPPDLSSLLPSTGASHRRAMLQQTPAAAATSGIDVAFRIAAYKDEASAKTAETVFRNVVESGSLADELVERGLDRVSISVVTYNIVININSPAESPSGGGGGGDMTMIGAAAGGGIVVLVIVLAVMFMMRRRKKKDTASSKTDVESFQEDEVSEMEEAGETRGGGSSKTKEKLPPAAPSTEHEIGGTTVMGLPAADVIVPEPQGPPPQAPQLSPMEMIGAVTVDDDEDKEGGEAGSKDATQVGSGSSGDAVTAILEASRLDDKYRQPLLDLGIAAASDLKDVVEEDLDSMGMTKLEKRRFLAAVAEL